MEIAIKLKTTALGLFTVRNLTAIWKVDSNWTAYLEHIIPNLQYR